MTERSCDDCRHHWPANTPSPKGATWYVPVCTKLRNFTGPIAATMARSIDYRLDCGPDALAWKPRKRNAR